jgi:hypothetical protein
MRRAIATGLVLVCVAAGCGGGDDDDDAGGTAGTEASATAADPADAGSAAAASAEAQTADAQPAGDAGSGEHGGISFTMTGGAEKSGSWAFVPEASSYGSGWWSMSFTDPSASTPTILAVSLNPDNMNVSYGDDEFTITGMPPMCTFDVEHQDANGAKGSIRCAHLTGLTVAGDNVDVGLSANFDASTGSAGMPGAAEPADTPAATQAAPASGSSGGQAEVTLSGGQDFSANWSFSPETSIYANGAWVMTFHDPANPITAGGPFVTLLLNDGSPNVSFSNGLITILDAEGQCDLQLDHQDDHGAAGSMTCSGVSAAGSGTPLDITITFDGTV